MSGLTALDHHVVNRALRELAAHRETAVAAADDGHIDIHHVLLVVTVMSVGLATMSNTAERFCDCATSAAICSGVASASIS
jgi:hypothetical protein